mmetsp:Transcript_40548/g.97861  ORF Transcript_40548/g.97861 Transcript_40548/m.97861 type:complete len:217 (+) Transcript_40548:390-1040(+)
MDSTTICFVSLSTEVSLPMKTTSFLEIMSIVESNRLNVRLLSLPTRSSTPRTFFAFEETTNVLLLIVSTVSTMSAREDTPSSYGKLLLTYSTAYPLLLLSMIRFYASMGDCLQNLLNFSKSTALCVQLTCRILVYCVTLFGPIQTRKLMDGVKMTVVSHLPTVKTLYPTFWPRMISTSLSGLIKSSKMVTSSLLADNLSLFSPLLTTAGNSITLEP